MGQFHQPNDAKRASGTWQKSGILFPHPAIVYFSGPWENILTLWQYLKNQLLQIANKTSRT